VLCHGDEILFLTNFEIVKCIEFLTAFVDPTLQEDPIHGKHKYMI